MMKEMEKVRFKQPQISRLNTIKCLLTRPITLFFTKPKTAQIYIFFYKQLIFFSSGL